MSRELLQMAADTIEAMWDRHAGGKLNIDAASSSFMHRAQLTLAALRAALAAPVEPVYWQWRRKSTPWSTEYIFNSQAHATSPDSEVRALYATPPAQPAIDGFGGNLDEAFYAAPAVRDVTAQEDVALRSAARRGAKIIRPAPAVREPLTDELIDSVILAVAELDYNSPPDMPDVMLVTADELRGILQAHAPAVPDLIPPDALFVCGQMGANVTRVRAESAAPAVREPSPECNPSDICAGCRCAYRYAEVDEARGVD